MKKIVFIILMLCASTALVAQNYGSRFKSGIKISKIAIDKMPKSALEKLNNLIAEAASKNDPQAVTYFQLIRYKIIIDNGFYESPTQVIKSMDSLRRSLTAPYSNAVAVAMMDVYNRFASMNPAPVSPVGYCDSIPLEQWSPKNYVEKYDQLTNYALADSTLLSSQSAMLLSPMLNFKDNVPYLSALELIGNRLFVANRSHRIYERIANLYKEFDKSESLILLNLYEFLRTNQDPKERLAAVKKVMDLSPKSDYLDQQINEINVIELWNADKGAEIMRLYADNPKYDTLQLFKEIIKNVRRTSIATYTVTSPCQDQSWLCKFQVLNGEEIVFSAYKVTDEEFQNVRRYYLEPIVMNKSAVLTWKQRLPAKSDYANHNYVVEMPGLKSGKYFIKAECRGAFDTTSQWLRNVVTDLLMFTLPVKNQAIVVDRVSGRPLANLPVKAYDNDTILVATLTTDKNGICDYTSILKGSASHSLKVVTDRGEAKINVSERRVFSDKVFHAQIFVDRPIYRPGQKVKFEVVAFNSQAGKHNVVPNKNLEVKLLVEGKVVDKLKLKSNDFGSASGEFQLPRNMAGGMCQIICDQDGVTFTVSEYKRPEIEIKLDTLNGFYPKDGAITLKGTVLTMNGVPVMGAKISYKVDNQEEKPIFSDVNGRFSITVSFEDKKMVKGVEITATAASGHTATANITLFNYTKSINIEVLTRQFCSESVPEVDVTNSQNNRIDVPINVVISKIQGKELLQDYVNAEILMKKQDFQRKFPEYQYGNTKPKLDQVFKSEYPNVDSLNAALSRLKLAQGRYQIKLVSPKAMADSTVAEFKIINPQTKKPLPVVTPYIYNKGHLFTPGDTVKIVLGTTNKNETFYIYKGTTAGGVFVSKIELSDCQRIVEIPIHESDQSKISIEIFSVNRGNFWNQDIGIGVGKNPDELRIEAVSLRNKMVPGAPERWSFKITDSRGKAADAEVLAYMYDASLLNLFKQNRYIMPQNRFWLQGAYNFYNISVSQLDVFPFGSGGRFYGEEFSLPQLRELLTPLNYFNETISRMVYTSAASRVITSKSVDYGGTAEGVVVNDGIIMEAKTSAAGGSDIRSDFSETALFMPELRTDKEGIVSVAFTAPGTMTRWNAELIAHTRDMKVGYLTFDVVTMKELMVTVNKPRYLRDGDEIVLSARVDNRTAQALECQPEMILRSLSDSVALDASLIMERPQQIFTIPAKGSETISWRVKTPEKLTGAIACQISVTAGAHTDGELIEVAVIDNRELVTETVPIIVPSGAKGDYSLNIRNDDGRENVSVKLELTTNPLWTVLEVLPVVASEKSEMNTILFNGYYANTLASYLKQNYKKQFEQAADNARKSIAEQVGKGIIIGRTPLLANESVKQVALEATPWLLEAESQQARAVATAEFFSGARSESENRLRELFDNQNGDGSFSWVARNGGFDRLTSLYIATGFGRLIDLGVLDFSAFEYKSELERLIAYLDSDFVRDNFKVPTMFDYYYIYMRSKFDDVAQSREVSSRIERVVKDAQLNWARQPIYMRAMIGSALLGMGDVTTAKKIAQSLIETTYVDKNGAMSWRQAWGRSWYQRPIETHTAVIELLTRLNPEKFKTQINQMKMWLLINKRGNSWGYSTATTDACYALLLDASSELDRKTQVRVSNAGKQLNLSSQEVGFKPDNVVGMSWTEKAVLPALGRFTVDASADKGIVVVGAIYYQYIQNRDKITSSKSMLLLERKFYVADKTGNLTETTHLKLGDRVKVRLVIEAKEDVDYVHLRDNRSVGFEPVVQVPEYNWTGSMTYYKMIKDTATDFFIRDLRRGVHIIEYDVVTTYKGDMSSGYAEIQSLYAPEFKATTRGNRVMVE